MSEREQDYGGVVVAAFGFPVLVAVICSTVFDLSTSATGWIALAGWILAGLFITPAMLDNRRIRKERGRR